MILPSVAKCDNRKQTNVDKNRNNPHMCLPEKKSDFFCMTIHSQNHVEFALVKADFSSVLSLTNEIAIIGLGKIAWFFEATGSWVPVWRSFSDNFTAYNCK